MFMNGIRKTLYAFRQIDVEIFGLLKLQPNEPHRAEWRLDKRLNDVRFTVIAHLCLMNLFKTLRVDVSQANERIAFQIRDQVSNF